MVDLLEQRMECPVGHLHAAPGGRFTTSLRSGSRCPSSWNASHSPSLPSHYRFSGLVHTQLCRLPDYAAS